MINHISFFLNQVTNNGSWAIRNNSGVHVRTSSIYNKLSNKDMLGVNINDLASDEHFAICLEHDKIALSTNLPLIKIEEYLVNDIVVTFETWRKKIIIDQEEFILVIEWKYSKEKHVRQNIDFLTGFSNKEHLDQVHNNEYQVCAFIDLDNFKNINDTYGHLEGDVVLKSVATSLKEHVRDVDEIIRWGGDEFLILFKSKNLKAIESKLQLVRLVFEKKHIKYKVSFSFGTSLISNNLTKSIEHADKKMYASKRSRKLLIH